MTRAVAEVLPKEQRCRDCAFTRGTEANRSDHTTMLAALCVLGHEPFHCHVEDRICVGYVEARQNKDAPEKPNIYAKAVGELFAQCVRLGVRAEDLHSRAIAAEEAGEGAGG